MVHRQPGSGREGAHGHNGYLGVFHLVGLDKAAVTPSHQVHVVLVGLLETGFGGYVQRLVQLEPPLHVFPFHVNVAVAAHALATVVRGEVQVFDEVHFGRQFVGRQEAVNRLLFGRLDGIAVVGDLPPVVGYKGRQQHVGVLAYLVGLDDRVHHVLRVLAVIVHPVDVPVHDGVLVIGADDSRRLQGTVRHYHDNRDSCIRSEDKLLGSYQQPLRVGGKGAAGARLGGSYLGIHNAAFVFQFYNFGGQFPALDHAGKLLTNFVGRADGEVAQYLHTGQFERVGRRLVAGQGLAPGGCRGSHQGLLNCLGAAKCPDGYAGEWKSRGGGAQP